MKKSLVIMSGNLLLDPLVFGDGTEVFPSIFLNHIRIGQQSILDKLKSAVEKYARERVIDGITFEKALKINVRVTGYRTEKGGKKNIKRTYWLVSTEPEN